MASSSRAVKCTLWQWLNLSVQELLFKTEESEYIPLKTSTTQEETPILCGWKISFSHRMSNEVTKSHLKRNELHKELGGEIFASWTQDHAQEVLSSQKYELWNKEEEKAKAALQKLEKASLCDGYSSDDASH